jgi:hypothetical protein
MEETKTVGKKSRREHLKDRYQFEDNTRMDLKETQCKGVECIQFRLGDSGGML